MRYFLLGVIAACLLVPITVQLNAGQRVDRKPEKQQIKARQKNERKLLKSQQHNTKHNLKRAEIPGSQRAYVKHQMKREKRELRERQRDEMQDFKDCRRLARERANH